ncbi:hypothetical protein MLD38_021790 [Melastoma candidum]|uniref:Uncharacterized protein n=1 Tax=Melastoma candidum TaxID=119954 RepID=A0ACB9QKL1_9MYRT|nr:hypothetical protein MLD38_021790 [Melastoma candidum]
MIMMVTGIAFSILDVAFGARLKGPMAMRLRVLYSAVETHASHNLPPFPSSCLADVRREPREAFLARATEEAKDDVLDSDPSKIIALPVEETIRPSESIPVYVLNPKQDLHGEETHMHLEGESMGTMEVEETGCLILSVRMPCGKSSALGFGIGALEELDVEDEDVHASGFDSETSIVEEVEEASRPSLDMPDKPRLTGKDNGVLHGFRLASNSDYMSQR